MQQEMVLVLKFHFLIFLGEHFLERNCLNAFLYSFHNQGRQEVTASAGSDASSRLVLDSWRGLEGVFGDITRSGAHVLVGIMGLSRS
jgi:hypothetical protein